MTNEVTYDSYTHFAGGMNSGFAAANLEADQYFKGVNVTCRDGRLTTRPSFKRLSLVFQRSIDRVLFEQGRFQGMTQYVFSGVVHVAMVVSGNLFLVDTRSGSVFNLSSASAELHQYTPRCWFLQVKDVLIVQDGISRPLIVTGRQARVSSADANEVPPGQAMAYGHGRLFVQVSDRAILAGDITMPNDPESFLVFDEHYDITLGGVLAVDHELGAIQSLTFAANFDTSTGDGPLLALCNGGIVSFRVDYNRSEWMDQVFSKLQVLGVGPTGPSASAHMNSDILFWSADGLRSLAVLKSEVTSARRKVNLSRELDDVVRKDTRWLAPRVYVVVWDGRLLIMTGGTRSDAVDKFGSSVEDYAFQGLLSVDFDPMTTNALEGRYSTDVSFDGVWTGALFTGLTVHDNVLYATCKDREGLNCVMRMDGTVTGEENGAPIECRVVTRAFSTKQPPQMVDTPFVPKQFDQVRVWLEDLEGNVQLRLWLAPDGSRLFRQLSRMELDNPTVSWDGQGASLPVTGVAQHVPGALFTAPAYQCIAAGSDLVAYTFQFALEWSGKASIARILVRTKVQHADVRPIVDYAMPARATNADYVHMNELDFQFRSF